MRSVEDQQSLVTAAAVTPIPVRVAITEAQGLLCAEEVVTTDPLPAFDQAAIDGYAVRAIDVATAGTTADGAASSSPDIVTLPVVGEIGAGSRTPARLAPGQAVRVHTGAPLPTLADAVVPEKWTDGGSARVRVGHGVRTGQYVRRTGDDVQPGDVAVKSGTVVGPAQVGLLAAVGRDRLLVHPRPRLSIISVGNELVDVDRTPGPGQVYDVASYAIAAAARDAGAEVHRVGIVPSDPATLRDAVEAQLVRAEIIVVAAGLGGTSSSDIKDAVSTLGELDVERVAMHPGSVQGFGKLGTDSIPTFLIPSNPMSALVVFEVMVRPLIRLALGKSQPMRRLVRAIATAPIPSPAGRKGYVRGQLMRDEDSGEYLVEPISDSGSHLLVSLAEANCLIVIDTDTELVRAGDEVAVAFLAQRT